MNPERSRYDSVVIGGGFFGTYFAVHLANQGIRTLLVEREGDLLQRASFRNQARVHRGYHYPRSTLTGLRSAANFARFVRDFSPAIESQSLHCYAIARKYSNVTAEQYRRFCSTIGAPLRTPPASIQRLFNPEMIEASFVVDEQVFNATILRELMKQKLEAARVETVLESEATRITPGADALVELRSRDGATLQVRAGAVFVCCYSETNTMIGRSGAARVALKHEITELALVRPPEELVNVGMTVMCGPFFSVVPFPARGLHTLSHVRYTPHYAWWASEHPDETPAEVLSRCAKRSHFPEMVRDAARYLPCMARAAHEDSIWEVKTILPESENNDSRPILFVERPESPNVCFILGAKIDNVYDVCDVYNATRTGARIG